MAHEPQMRELARRVTDGVEIALFWWPADGSTSLQLTQLALGATFSFLVPRDRALDAYYHPFAHLPVTQGELAA